MSQLPWRGASAEIASAGALPIGTCVEAVPIQIGGSDHRSGKILLNAGHVAGWVCGVIVVENDGSHPGRRRHFPDDAQIQMLMLHVRHECCGMLRGPVVLLCETIHDFLSLANIPSLRDQYIRPFRQTGHRLTRARVAREDDAAMRRFEPVQIRFHSLAQIGRH